MRRVALVLALVALGCVTARGQADPRAPRKRGYPPDLPGAKVEVYKTVGDVELKLYIYTPEGQPPREGRPAIVFFFGGGWRGGSPGQFHQQCKYLASRGMVAMTADYRVLSRHGTRAKACVADGKSAVRWIRANAARLGVDPKRIAAGGGSAGGHVAASTGTVTGFDESGEDTEISSVPNAMVLFNPAVVLAPIEGKYDLPEGRAANLKERMGTDPVNLSPYHHVAKGAPPTIIFHGTKDTAVPYRTVELFAEKMTSLGNRCLLIGYEGQGHGFFNAGRGDGTYFIRTVRATDAFLAKLGYLEGPPTLEPPK